MSSRTFLSGVTVWLFAVATLFSGAAPQMPLASFDEVREAKRDLWGEAAMRQTNGASYEFFENLLPPPRYVNADFHFYPIVLSASDAKVKARLVSNGSGINLRGGARGWNNFGTPVTFRVGPDELRFGEVLTRLQHPTLDQGFFPIVRIQYEHPTPKHDSAKTAGLNSIEPPEVYKLEAFASTDPLLAESGVVFVSFSLVGGSAGFVTTDLDWNSSISFTNGKAVNAKGEIVAYFDKSWKWERGSVHSTLNISKENVAKRVVLAIPTQPLDPSINFSLEKFSYDKQLQTCRDSWQKRLDQGISIEAPEPLVNNAWKHLVIQDFMVCKGSNLNYSHGNQYEKKYAAETSDAAVPLMSFGYEEDMRRFLPVILNLNDPRLTNHFASHKLDTVCRYYWQTRDIEFVKSLRSRWQKELDWILDHRGEHGLLPKDNYCTDIEQPVYSFSSNAKCWAALRDMVPVLQAIGDREMAARVADAAATYKKDILAAIATSIRTETDPPFVPCALFGAEDIHDPITETRIGSYYDLVVNYIIGSGIFIGTEKEDWLPHYLETHGGLCMGLTRSAATNHTFWMGKHRTNPLYGMRYVNDCLRRDDVERALVNFYGMLAHGMTRNTFIGAEGTALQPLDEGGRQFYCPPNTASNGEWLWTLRHLLVQDFDMNNDGSPETVRLAYGTPKRWLEDGKAIVVKRAPTAFGIVSFKLESRLSKGEVIAEVELPARNRPQNISLRARLPEGWKNVSAEVDGKSLATDKTGAVDLSAFSGKQTIRFLVSKE